MVKGVDVNVIRVVGEGDRGSRRYRVSWTKEYRGGVVYG